MSFFVVMLVILQVVISFIVDEFKFKVLDTAKERVCKEHGKPFNHCRCKRCMWHTHYTCWPKDHTQDHIHNMYYCLFRMQWQSAWCNMHVCQNSLYIGQNHTLVYWSPHNHQYTEQFLSDHVIFFLHLYNHRSKEGSRSSISTSWCWRDWS